VLNGIAREFGVFDHWFSEVPSQTFMNRSFWTAATSSGIVVNSPAKKWLTQNDAETIFERLEQHGKTWKIYVMEPMPLSFHGIIHFARLKDRLATNVVPFAEFERDAAAGALPDFSFIEPNFISGHGDYHPAFGRSFPGLNVDPMDPPSSMLAGEAFLARIYDAYRSCTSGSGTNVWNTALLIGWDEPGGTYDHVPPGAAAVEVVGLEALHRGARARGPRRTSRPSPRRSRLPARRRRRGTIPALPRRGPRRTRRGSAACGW